MPSLLHRELLKSSEPSREAFDGLDSGYSWQRNAAADLTSR